MVCLQTFCWSCTAICYFGEGSRVDAQRESRAFRAWGALYPLHTGHIPALLGTLIIFTVGLGLALVVIGGIAANALRNIRPLRPKSSPARRPPALRQLQFVDDRPDGPRINSGASSRSHVQPTHRRPRR